LSAQAASSRLAVLRLLADGELHSGEALAAELGISRAAVWKQVRGLARLDLGVDAMRGKGYRLGCRIDLLDANEVPARLAKPVRRALEQIDVLEEVDSTNSFLLARSRPAPGKLRVCLAEYQSGGRGRRGRTWLAPFGRGLCLSVGWQFESQPQDLAALALAAGVVARRALIELTSLPIQIKWPNDLLFDGKKLGGILVELAAESHGPCHAVVGIGVNVSATPELTGSPSAWAGGAVDLATATGNQPPSRNALAATLIDALASLLQGYAHDGFSGYHAELADADYLQGRRVDADGVVGTAIGVAADGTLLVETDAEVRKILAGDVSVRPES
jgi:BirA family biotin operon repressor/biotin-[acetyl-CoA-carboxylase] ligase